MEVKNGVTEVATKILESPIVVPNPRAYQSQAVAQMTMAAQPPGQSKYVQLLGVMEELSRDIRPTYAGSRSSAERIKRGIIHARILVRECLVETERNARQ